MKTQYLFFASVLVILPIILIMQNRQKQVLENTLNKIENNYSNLNTNLNTNLANLNTSLTNLNSNITNLSRSRKIKKTSPPPTGMARMRAMRSSQPLFLLELDDKAQQ